MPVAKPSRKATTRKKRLAESIEALTALQFGPKQRNETAAYTLLALLDLQPDAAWTEAQAALRGITPIIDFIATVSRCDAPKTMSTSIYIRTSAFVISPAFPWATQVSRGCNSSSTTLN